MYCMLVLTGVVWCPQVVQHVLYVSVDWSGLVSSGCPACIVC